MDETLSQPYSAQERLRFERQRRIVYCIAGGLGVLLILYDLWRLLGAEGETQTLRWFFVVNDLLFVIVAALIVWVVVTRRMDLDRVERWMFHFFAFQAMIFNGLLPALTNDSLQRRLTETIGDDIWFLLVICALAMHIFPLRRGILLVLAVYGGSALMVLAELIYRTRLGDSVELALLVGEIYVMGAALLCFLYLLARYRDNARRIQLRYEMLEHIAYIDPLTSLPNRRRLYEILEDQHKLAARYQQSFALAIWDIDHFKQVNDTYGHDMGDRVLAQVADIVHEQLRTTDQLGRWGGEEFLIILPQTNLASAQFVAERICHTIGTSHILDGKTITASFGVAAHLPGEGVADLLRRADRAMYQAKTEGRNQVCVDDPSAMKAVS
jgi:diguanylate cyclase